MSRLYMLDTNIISSLVREPFGRVRSRIVQAGADNICASVITAAELRYGAVKKGSPELRDRVKTALSLVPVLPLPPDAASHYGSVRAELERLGKPIGANDYWIAAHALAEDAILVSNNMREFMRVPDLHVENWLEQT